MHIYISHHHDHECGTLAGHLGPARVGDGASMDREELSGAAAITNPRASRADVGGLLMWRGMWCRRANGKQIHSMVARQNLSIYAALIPLEPPF